MTTFDGRAAAHPFPRLRWWALAWLAIYVPAYLLAYPAWNFLFLCNLGVLLTSLALVAGNRLLISSQAVGAPIVGLVWTLDAGWRLFTGAFLFGGTAYMWDPQNPLFTRLLSLYHIAWPLLLVTLCRRGGYDRRGWPLQTAILATGLLIARLFTGAVDNVNFAFRDPFWQTQFGPVWLHIALSVLIMSALAYGLTHWLLARYCPRPAPALAERASERL